MKMKKRIRQFLAWLVAICMTLGALELNMTAVAAESDDDSAYKYTFYDYESGKYTYWEKSPYLINAPWYPGGVFRDYAGLLYLYGDGESDVAAYCADLAQTFTNNWKYKRINLEDASYFDNEHAAKLRAVFSKDTVDEKEYRNYYWHDWSNEELAYAQSKVSGLTRAQALSATQIAIWYCCNGGEMKNTTITKDDVTKVAETFNAMLSLAGGAHVIYKYKGFNGGEIPLETEQDCNDYAKSSSNISALRNKIIF